MSPSRPASFRTRMRIRTLHNTLSGHLRRAIHRSRRRLEAIAESAGIAVEDLNLFLRGKHAAIRRADRLALAVEFTKGLQAVGQPPENKS